MWKLKICMLIPLKCFCLWTTWKIFSLLRKYLDPNFKTVGSVHPKRNSLGYQTIEFTN